MPNFLFELRQYENTLWYLRNLIQMRMNLPLFPLPNYDQLDYTTRMQSDLEVVSRCADIKAEILKFADKDFPGAQDLGSDADLAWGSFVDRRLLGIYKVIRTIDSRIEEQGYLVLNSENTPYTFNSKADIPPPQGASDPAYRPVHHALFQSASQVHAFDWMCQLDRILEMDREWLLPEAPQPLGHVSGLLYNYNEELAGRIARIVLRSRHQNVNAFVYAYGFEIVLPSLVPNIDLIEANLQAEMEERRKRKKK